MFFQWAQLKHAFPTKWKTLISNYSDTEEENLCENHHVIKGARICLPINYPLRKYIQF